MAGNAEAEVEEMKPLADLIVRKSSETEVLVQLADDAAALEWQASQGWPKVERR